MAGRGKLVRSNLNMFKTDDQIDENIGEICHPYNGRNCENRRWPDDTASHITRIYETTFTVTKTENTRIRQRQLHEQQQQQQQSQLHQNQSPIKATPRSGISTNNKNISHYHRNNGHHSYKKKVIIHLNRHVQLHLHHKPNNRIFHKTHHLSSNKFRHRQMKETMLYVVWRHRTMTVILISNYVPAHPAHPAFDIYLGVRFFPGDIAQPTWNKNSIYIKWKLLQDMKHYWMSATSIVTIVTWQLLLIYSNSKTRLTHTTTICCNKLQIITNNKGKP